MKEIQISDILIIRLKDYGIIKWHKNDNHSFYLKFRDVRLGSIRIANHKGRERYHYTYEIFNSDKDIHRKIEDICESIKNKSSTLNNFNPEKWIVWDKEKRGYKEVKNYQEYKDSIWSK